MKSDPTPPATGVSGKVLLAAGGGIAAVLGLVAGGVAWSKKRAANAAIVADAQRTAARIEAGLQGSPAAPSGPDTTVADINTGVAVAGTAVKVAGTVADIAAAV